MAGGWIYERKAKAPTAFMLGFRSKLVSADSGEMEMGAKGVMRPKMVKIAVEYRNVCPWNPDIDMLSDECMKCESCLRHGTDRRYPPYAVVCKKQLDKVEVLESAKEKAQKIIEARVMKEIPAAIERYKRIQRERKATVDRNALMNETPKAKKDKATEKKETTAKPTLAGKKKKMIGHLGKEKGNKVTDVLIPAGEPQNAQ